MILWLKQRSVPAIGATDREGGDVTATLCTPYDYAGTIHRKLGFSRGCFEAQTNA